MPNGWDIGLLALTSTTVFGFYTLLFISALWYSLMITQPGGFFVRKL